jgi:hypothetical protein
MALAGTSKTPPDGNYAEELIALQRRVDALAAKVEALAAERIVAPAEIPTAAPAGETRPAREGLGAWLSRSAVLPRVAAVCFILVFALLLRTLTDYAYLNIRLGSLLGLGYVILLIGLGARYYVKQRPLAPVFAGCGFLLLFSIVIESLNRFHSLSPASAMLLLSAALVAGAFIGMRHQAPGILGISVLGVVLSAMIIGFPRIIFPAAGGLLVAASLTVFLADYRGVSRSLKWLVTLLALSFWFLWAFKLFMAGRHGESPAPFAAGWFLPELMVFGGLYLGYYGVRFFRAETINIFDAVLPTLNMLLLFLAGRVMVVGFGGHSTLFGSLALGMATIHFLAGWRLSRLDRGRCGATGGAMVAGAVMLALGLPELLGQVAWAMPGWVLVAYGLARLSDRCNSGVIRAISYLYQAFAFWIGLMGGVLTSVKPGGLPAALVAAGSLALGGLAQYHWCRQHPPPAGTMFASLDRRDHSAILLLLVGLAGCYFFGALLLDHLTPLFLEEPGNTMRCGRSLLINGGALILLLAGSRERKMELIRVAVALAVLGCLKVFFVDLFRSNGLPLVLSVLSFGIVAAFGSVIMGRWQKAETGTAGVTMALRGGKTS